MDPHSGISHYRVGLGTHPYSDDMEPMTSTGLRTCKVLFTISSADTHFCQHYFVSFLLILFSYILFRVGQYESEK